MKEMSLNFRKTPATLLLNSLCCSRVPISMSALLGRLFVRIAKGRNPRFTSQCHQHVADVRTPRIKTRAGEVQRILFRAVYRHLDGTRNSTTGESR